MASSEVKLGGAWAAFEQQQTTREAVIDQLCSQLAELTTMHQRLCQDYAQLQTAYNMTVSEKHTVEADYKTANLQRSELAGQLETSNFLRQELAVAKQDSISRLEQSIQQSESKAAQAEQEHQLAAQSLQQQNAELRDIIAASMHTKRASTIKLETAMNALNLSKGNASRFIQELEAVKGKVEQLTAERDRALASHVIACQQRDCHANHAQLLTRDNKRLATQLQAQQQEHSAMQRAWQQNQSESAVSRKDVRDASAPAMRKAKQQNEKHTAVNVDDCNIVKRSFEGKDVGNVMHKQPFDLSKSIVKPAVMTSKAVLRQAQQLRLAA